MKTQVIRILQRILGYTKYLYVFSICKIATLNLFPKKWDYLHFKNQFNTDSNVIVIGASTGITTIPLARKCSHGKVLAYEPILNNYNTIVRLIHHYKLSNCEVFNIGLGDVTCQKETMLIPIIGGIKKQGMAHMDGSEKVYDTYVKEYITIDKLDDREEVKNIHIDGIKLIAENHELEILHGSKKTIMRCKPIIYCELWNNEKRDKVISFMKSIDYGCYHRIDGKYEPVINYRNRNLFFKPCQ